MMKKILLFCSPFFIFFYFIFNGINLPYVGPNAYNFIIYTLIAHNYNTMGYIQTRLGSIISVASTIPQNPEYFIHHPFLLSLIQSVFLRILGEDFWVGRLVVIFFAFGIFLLTFFIGKLIANKKFGFISLFIMALIPATTLFGKMIGQEPLVLFFILLTLYLSLLYLKSNNKKFLYLGIASTILGTLSDWPMLLFTFFLIPLFAKNKKLHKGFFFPIFSFITVLLLILWIAWIRNGFSDLQSAVQTRSFVGLINISLWPVLWAGSTFLRFLIYFNPFFVLLAGISIFESVKQYKAKKITNKNLVILLLSGFGLTYLLLYTQATFTHPYLIYYLLPVIAFGAASIVEKLLSKRKVFFILLGCFFSIMFLLLVTNSKNEQMYSNLWRYQVAHAARQYFIPYETIVVNKYSAFETEIWRYPLLIRTQEDPGNSIDFFKNFDHYFYSCQKTCDSFRLNVNLLKEKYAYIEIKSKEAEAYVFFLKKPQYQNTPLSIISIKKVVKKKNYIADVYRAIRDDLKVPQL